MTREEAITQLELLLEYCESMMTSEYPVWRRDCEALQMLIAALRPVSREQVERMRGEWQVCFEDWRKQIAGDQCSKCGFQHYGTSINHYHFCPACGAPMTDDAVQMVMERMEALHENNGCL